MENALDWLALLCISLVFVRIVTFNRQGPGEGMYIARRSFPHPTTKRGSRKLTFLQFDSACVPGADRDLNRAARRSFYRGYDDNQDRTSWLKIWAIRISSSTICRTSPIELHRADPMLVGVVRS
jgi:hypothetical protein